MSRFIVLEFPKHIHMTITQGRKAGMRVRTKARRILFNNNEVGAIAYCNLTTKGFGNERGDGKRRHVIDTHLKATTYRVSA